MSLFSKKVDTLYVKEFDNAITNINSFASKFHELHVASLKSFQDNFKKEKGTAELEKERARFEKQLDILQKLKFNCDLLLDESVKMLRNETALTEKDRVDLRNITRPRSPTGIKVQTKSS
ncbi:hypothetical protein HQ545_06565 [Candidatus Woesearchaeota archaeon]|nr:hypothetical protein [Candidatus Woesearchaeota archaeon]